MAANSLSLSSLFRDPELRRAFARVERDNGATFALPTPRGPELTGGAVVETRELELA